jgi:hypothetical protein
VGLASVGDPGEQAVHESEGVGVVAPAVAGEGAVVAVEVPEDDAAPRRVAGSPPAGSTGARSASLCSAGGCASSPATP